MLKEYVKDIKSGKPINQKQFYRELTEFARLSYIKVAKRYSIELTNEDIDDIVHDAILELIKNNYEKIKRINDIDKSASYIFKTVRNMIFNLCKKRNKIKPEDLFIEKEDGENLKNEQDKKFIFKGDHTDFLVGEEYLEFVKEFLKNIKNKKHKQIFLMKLNNIKTSIISNSTGLTQSNINTIFSRLKNDLVRIINQNCLNNINDEILRELYEWFKDEYKD